MVMRMKLQHETIFHLTDEKAADALLDIIENDFLPEIQNILKENDNEATYKAFTVGFYTGMVTASSTCNLDCENCIVQDCIIISTLSVFSQLKNVLENEGRDEAKRLILSMLRAVRSEMEYANRHYG